MKKKQSKPEDPLKNNCDHCRLARAVPEYTSKGGKYCGRYCMQKHSSGSYAPFSHVRKEHGN